MRLKFLLMFLLVFSLAFATATFQLGEPNNTISTEYALGASLAGTINISFDSEPINSIITNNLGDSISLEGILNNSLNSGFSYTCNTPGCSSTYAQTNPETQKQLILDANQSKTFGFRFSGIINSINSLEFNVASNAPSSCTNQVKIDLLSDGVFETGNTGQSIQTCGEKNYSCFDLEENPLEITLSQVPFCQKFTLEEAPGFEIGAWIKETQAGDKSLSMGLFDLSGNELESCELSKNIVGLGDGIEVSCNIEHLVPEVAEYYICVVEGAGTGTYKTKGYTPVGEKCGFNGLPPQTPGVAYQMFAQNSKFSSVRTIQIENMLSSGELLSVKMENYIIETYGSLDCSQVCLVPLTINSNINQEITLNNLQLEYDLVNLPNIIENKFYDFNTAPAKINSSFQNLFFDQTEFSIPPTIGYNEYILDLNNEEIYEGNFSVRNISISISPTNIPVLFPTKITAQVESENEIVKYNWNFGDNSTQTTFTSEVEHTYSQVGNFNLILEVTDEQDNVFSKLTLINVNTSNEIINSKITQLNSKILNLESQMALLDDFTSQMLDNYIGLNETKAELKQIELNYSLNENDTSFIPSLINLNLPKRFIKTTTSKISYYPLESSINLDILEAIQGENYDRNRQSDYSTSILIWFQKNIDAKIMLTEIFIEEDEGLDPGFRIFSLDITKKQALSEDPDVVVGDLEGLTFKSIYGKNLTNGYVHFKLSNSNHLEIYTTEKINFQELPLFISPRLSQVFVPVDLNIEPAPKNYKLLIMIILIILVIGLGIFAYFMIGKWYKTKYENKLFPNKNNLLNMITYVNNSKKKGMANNKIRKNLSKVGWNSEQIGYVMKKYVGRNTGVPGIK